MTAATLDPQMTTRLDYEPPGPGAWSADVDHQSSPRGLLMQELFAPNFEAGMRACFVRYGMPLDRLEGRHVHGWFFMRPVPAGVPDTGKAPPPTAVLKVLVRLAPELRRRRRTAAATLADARWLVDAREWADERASWIARTEQLLAVDLDALDDAALTEQVRLALAISGQMLHRHFSLVGISVAVGRLIVAGRRWGLAPTDVVALLRGSSPSSSASRTPLVELAALTAGRSDLRTVADLRSVSPRADQLVDHYLSQYGWRPLAYDVEASTLAEHPDLLVDLVRSQAERVQQSMSDDPVDSGRGRVAAAARPEFDRLVGEARECYSWLDDNSGVAAWTIGVLRRVVLEVGSRAHGRAVLTRADDVFNLTSDELLVLAAGGSPVGAEVLADRRRERTMAAQQPPPPVIGGAPVPPPDPSVFPDALAEIAGAVVAYLGEKFTAAPDTARPALTGVLTVDGQQPVTGLPVVGGTVDGRIIVSHDPADALERIEPGDILVCTYTTPAHNAIFPMLGGVLTQFGGPLGHTAVMAREFGIPAVVDAGSLPLHLDGHHGRLAVDLPS
jgi:phosphohistidine swiveling domain-containing protein